jgi:hypothetical protein
MQVNAETLQEKVKWLEIYKARMNISLNEEYQLEAYKMLLELLRQQCQHEWFKGKGAERCCADCGKEMPKHD